MLRKLLFFILLIQVTLTNPKDLYAQTQTNQIINICFEADSQDESIYFFLSLNINEESGDLEGVLAVNDADDMIRLANLEGKVDFEKDEVFLVDEAGNEQIWQVVEEGIISPEGQFFQITTCEE